MTIWINGDSCDPLNALDDEACTDTILQALWKLVPSAQEVTSVGQLVRWTNDPLPAAAGRSGDRARQAARTPRSARRPVDCSLPANTPLKPTVAWRRPWSPASGPPWKSCERWRESFNPTVCPDAHSNRVDNTDGPIGGAVGRAALRHRLRGVSQPGVSPGPSRWPAARQTLLDRKAAGSRGLPLFRSPARVRVVVDVTHSCSPGSLTPTRRSQTTP